MKKRLAIILLAAAAALSLCACGPDNYAAQLNPERALIIEN